MIKASVYQKKVAGILSEIFGKKLVKIEWDALSHDIHSGSHKSKYGPRVDIAIGPFNTGVDLDIGHDRTSVMKTHPLVQKIKEERVIEISWNKFARCFLAIEIVFSGASKYLQGDIMNATSTGAMAFIITKRSMYQKLTRTSHHLQLLQGTRLHENSLRNLVIFEDVDFLTFLSELQHPEKVKLLSVKEKYPITLKRFLFKKKIYFPVFKGRMKARFSKKEKKKFSIYGFDIKNVKDVQDIIFPVSKYTTPSSAFVYEAATSKGDDIKFMEILDMSVHSKYRNKGIGTQLLRIFLKIARENNCGYVVVELQRGRPGEPLAAQKRFFEKNGFNLWYDKRSEFSGWIAKKALK